MHRRGSHQRIAIFDANLPMSQMSTIPTELQNTYAVTVRSAPKAESRPVFPVAQIGNEQHHPPSEQIVLLLLP